MFFSDKNINKQNIKNSCLFDICVEKGFSTQSSEMKNLLMDYLKK